MNIKQRLEKLESQSSDKAETPAIKPSPILSPETWMFLFQPGFDGELTDEQMVEVNEHRKWMTQRHEH